MPTLSKDEISAAPVSASDRVVEAIKAGIGRGKYMPGQRLVEAELSTDLGVSRNTLREGMHRLALEGLLKIERHKGVSVRKISRLELAELATIRSVLEGLAAAEAARKSARKDRQALLELALKHTSGTPPSIDAYRKYNARFHRDVIRMSGFEQLQRFVDLTKLDVFRLYFETSILSPERIVASCSEHQQVAEAIMSGLPERAEEAMREHISCTIALMLKSSSVFFDQG